MVDLFRDRKWDLVSRRRIYYLISLVLLGTGLGTLISNWSSADYRPLNLGIDFMVSNDISVPYSNANSTGIIEINTNPGVTGTLGCREEPEKQGISPLQG